MQSISDLTSDDLIGEWNAKSYYLYVGHESVTLRWHDQGNGKWETVREEPLNLHYNPEDNTFSISKSIVIKMINTNDNSIFITFPEVGKVYINLFKIK